jgi:transposase
MPLIEAIRDYVLVAERIHADDTTVPVLDTGKTRTGRLWTYVRDDRPFGGVDPPAAIYFYSPDRRGEHPAAHLASYSGLMQADAYGGYNQLYLAGRHPGPIVEAACWAHARRYFFDQARLAKAGGNPLISRSMANRASMRRTASMPIGGRASADPPGAQPTAGRGAGTLVARAVRRALPVQQDRPGNRLQSQQLGGPDPLPRRRPPVPVQQCRRKSGAWHRRWPQQLDFAGSDAGGRRAAAIYTLIETAKLNDVDPQAWLTDVLKRIQDHPAKRIGELLPWNWKSRLPQQAAA